MRYLLPAAVSVVLAISGCATSPTKFYADPSEPNDTSLCRVALDAKADPQFRHDVTAELTKRGMTLQSCQDKVNTENAVGVAAVLVGVTTAAVIACSNQSCGGGGGGGSYFRDKDCYGGTGNGPDWQYGPIWVGSYDPYHLDADHDGTGCEASDLAYGS